LAAAQPIPVSELALMTAIAVAFLAALLVLLVVIPTYVVIRDLRSGRPDPGAD
jgi:hypothetical protein